MADLITLSYAKALLRITDSSSDVLLQTLLSAASAAIEHYCRRHFSPVHCVELYDAPTGDFLVLRSAPVLQLNAVTLYPDNANATVYTAASFDLRPEMGRISFKPGAGASFYYSMGARAWAACPATPRTPVALVDYYAGYGYLLTAAAAYGPGNAVVTPSAMAGFSSNAAWQISVGDTLVADPGTPLQETVVVSAAGAGTFNATFANGHAAGSTIAGALVPDDVQLAAGMATANLFNQPDLTKQRESMGKTIGYEYVVRAGQLLFTPEVLAILNRYRDAIV